MATIICTVTNDLNHDQRMHRICTSLQTYGHKVTLVGRKRKLSEKTFPKSFNQVRLNCWFSSGKAFYFEYNIRLFLWLLVQPCDVINSIDLDTLLPGYLISRLRGKKLVYDAHEYFSEVPEVVDRPIVKKAWESLAAWLIPKANLAYTVSESLAMEFEQRYQRPFGLVRNLPLRRDPVEVPKADPPVILYQGALNEGRGLEPLIEAMTMVEGARLWLAGEGDLSVELREMVNRHGLAQKVRFLGYLLPDELREITPRSTIGYNLLENRGLSYYYSLANKSLDYIQAGIASLQPSFPEYLDIQSQYGCFQIVHDPEPKSIGRHLNELLSNAERRKQIEDHCRRAARELVWEKEEVRLIQYYEEILSP